MRRCQNVPFWEEVLCSVLLHLEMFWTKGRAVLSAQAYAVNDQFSRVLSQQMEYYSNDLNADRIYQLEGDMSQVINDVLNPIWNQAFDIVVEDGLEDKLILAYRVFLGVSI
ncbi:hypothetical protein SAY87_023262 [Trapa incisa]|uniref:Uncharacterized protein n=1 Tax=Trapa incisa TaxID=236973 RepID=A0AAN7K8X7_9MYRT|nr:hypothetical protein SAY87_023262 [Trapa incisa]